MAHSHAGDPHREGHEHFDPASYDARVRVAIPGYDEFQDLVVTAPGVHVRRVLDLGTGTGATASAVTQHHSEATIVLLDASAEMLGVATASLPSDRVERVVVGDLVEAFPEGPFDLVVSALAIHHLEAERKRALFAKARAALAPSGAFIMGDLIVPEDPADASVELTPDHDRPDRLADLLSWLDAAGFDASVLWERADLAVVRSDAAPSS